jgi:hypothetical protein
MARSSLVIQGKWSEAELIYRYASRYHALPMLGLASVLASVLASRRLIRRCDARDALPAVLGTFAGVVMFAVQYHEVESDCFPMLHHPDQQATMAALHHVQELAVQEGISRTHLERLITPAVRSWNVAIKNYRTEYLSFMKLLDVPETAIRRRSDDEVRDLLEKRLTPAQRLALGSGACAYLRPAVTDPHAQPLSVARLVRLSHISEVAPRQYRSEDVPAFILLEFQPTSLARYLELPGLLADQELIIFRIDAQGRWRPGQNLHWEQPRQIKGAMVNLDGLIHWWGEPITQIAIQFTRPGQISLSALPRLLR